MVIFFDVYSVCGWFGLGVWSWSKSECFDYCSKDTTFLFIALYWILSFLFYANVVYGLGYELEILLFVCLFDCNIFSHSVRISWELGIEIVIFWDHEEWVSFDSFLVEIGGVSSLLCITLFMLPHCFFEK